MWTTPVIFLFLLLAILSVEGRGGGRGGGGRGGSRGSRGSRSRSSSSSSSKVKASVARYRGPVYRKSSWKTMAGAATVYGLANYKARSLYHKYPDREPTVCFNAENLKGGAFGYFICPEPGMRDTMVYCCGEEGDQKCCTSEEATGNTQSEVTAIALEILGTAIMLLVFAGFYYCCKR